MYFFVPKWGDTIITMLTVVNAGRSFDRVDLTQTEFLLDHGNSSNLSEIDVSVQEDADTRSIDLTNGKS